MASAHEFAIDHRGRRPGNRRLDSSPKARPRTPAWFLRRGAPGRDRRGGTAAGRGRGYHASVWAAADQDAARVRAEAERYAAELRANAEDYVERALADAVDHLRRSAMTADRGRAELAGDAPRPGRPAVPAPCDRRRGSARRPAASSDWNARRTVRQRRAADEAAPAPRPSSTSSRFPTAASVRATTSDSRDDQRSTPGRRRPSGRADRLPCREAVSGSLTRGFCFCAGAWSPWLRKRRRPTRPIRARCWSWTPGSWRGTPARCARGDAGSQP